MKKNIFLDGPRATRSTIKKKNVGALGTRKHFSYKECLLRNQAGEVPKIVSGNILQYINRVFIVLNS